MTNGPVKYDEFGIPIKPRQNVDEFGVPIKKVGGEQEVAGSSTSSGPPAEPSGQFGEIHKAANILAAKAARGDKTAEASLEFIRRKLEPQKPAEAVDIESVEIENPSESTQVQPEIDPTEQVERQERVPEMIALNYRTYAGQRSKGVEATGDLTRQEARDVANLTALDYLDYRATVKPDVGVYERDKYLKIKETPLEDRDETDESFLRRIESEALEARFLAEQQELRDIQVAIEDAPDEQTRRNLYGDYLKKKESMESLRSTHEMVPGEYQKIADLEEETKKRKEERFENLKQPASTWTGFKARAGEFVDQLAGAVGSGIASTGQVPKIIGDLLGNQTYGWTDELFDSIENVKLEREAEFGRPEKEGESFKNLPLSSKLSLIGGSAIGSAMLYGAGGRLGGPTRLGQRGATFGTAFLTSQGDYYSEALAAGMTPKEAAAAGTFLATVTGAVESIIPDVKYFEPSAFRASLRNSVSDAVKSGLPVKEALKQGTKEAINALPESAKSYLKSAGKEGGEEAIGQLGEDLGKELINSLGEQEYFKDTFDPEAYQEAVLGGFIAGGGLNVFSRPGPKSPTSEETLLEIAKNDEKVLASLDPNNDSDKNIIMQAAENLDALKTHSEWGNLSREEQAHALALSLEVKQIEEEQKTVGKVGLTDVAKEERIAELQGELSKIFESEPKEFTAYRFGEEGSDGVTFSSKNKDYSEEYAKTKGGMAEDVKEVKFTAKNPLVVTLPPNEFSSPAAEKNYINQAKREGNDLVIFRDEENGDEFYAQIKQEKASVEASSPKPLNQNPTKEIEVANVEENIEPANETVTDGNIQPEPVAEQSNTEPLGTGAMGEEGRADTGLAPDAQVQEESVIEERKLTKPEKERLSGIKKALNPEDVISSTGIDRRSDEEMMDQGKLLTESGEIKPEEIIAEINEKPRAIQPAEVAALVYYKAKLDNEIEAAYDQVQKGIEEGTDVTDAREKANKLEEKLLQYQTMSLRSGYEQSLAFRLRKRLLDSGYNLAAQITRYKANNGGVIPEEVEKRMVEADKQIKEANKRIEELEKEKEAYEAAQALISIQQQATRVNRPEIRTTLANKIRKAKIARPNVFNSSNPAVVVFDGAVELVATAVEAGEKLSEAIKKGVAAIKESDWYKNLAEDQQKEAVGEFRKTMKAQRPQIEVTDGKVKIPTSIIREYAESGVNNIDDLSELVLQEIQEDNPDVTLRDVKEAIVGYGKKTNPTEDVIRKEIGKMRRIGRLQLQLEDLRNRIPKEKNFRRKQEMSQKEKEILAEIKKEFPEYGKMTEAERLEATKKRTAEKIAELEDRVKRKDFAKKPARPPVDYDAELLKLEAEKVRAKEVFDYEHEKLELSQRGKGKKLWDLWRDLWNAPKAIRASLDMSAPLRQGAVFLLTQNPKKSVREIRDMYKFAYKGFDGAKMKMFEKKDFYDKWLSAVKASDMYPLMKQSELYIAEENAKLTAREEVFMSGLLRKLPVVGKGVGNLPANAPTVAKAIYGMDLSGASQRAYEGFLNKQRVDNFVALAENFIEMGLDPKKDAEEFKGLAKFVNAATARGELTDSNTVNSLLNFVFFSPRFISARLSLINPYFYYKLPPQARKVAMKKTGAFFGVIAGIGGLLALAAFVYDDEDEFSVEVNPLSSDFWKVRMGSVRIDFMAGYQQYFRTGSQVVMGQKKTTTTGETIDKNRILAAWELFANKFAPVPAVAYKGLMAEDKNGILVDQNGNVLDVTEDLTELGIPLYLSDVKELSREQGIPMTIFLAALSFHGEGVSSYGSVGNITDENYKKLEAEFEERTDREPTDKEKDSMMKRAASAAEREVKQNQKELIKNNK